MNNDKPSLKTSRSITMKLPLKSIACTALLSASLLSPIASALEADKVQTVDKNTPDSVLLEGKDTETMFKVLQPSERLSFSIEGIDNKIHVSESEGEIVLHAIDVDQEDIAKIKRTYEMISDNTNYTVKQYYSNSEFEKFMTSQANTMPQKVLSVAES